MQYSSTNRLVATVIAPRGKKIFPTLLEAIARLSGTAGARNVETEWLGEEEAFDVTGTGLGADGWRGMIGHITAPEPLDIIVQHVEGRRKKFLAADMESTIIQQEMLDELANDIGAGEQVAAITKRAMNGELNFGAALRERIALFDGKPISLLENAAKRITMMPGAETLVATMKKNGAATWLITGGFSYFAKPVAEKLGFDQCYANDLIIKDKTIGNGVTEPILDRKRKKELFLTALNSLKLTSADSLAVGDGANDIPMLHACNEDGGLGIAYHAKPKVREVVGHQINHCDLTALLYAQGYKKEEFVTA